VIIDDRGSDLSSSEECN